MKKNNAKYFIDNDSLFSHGAVIFLVLSCVFCLLGSLGGWDDRFFVVSQVFLPAASTLVLVIFMKLFGRRLFWMTSFPVVSGLAFFVIKALTYGSILYSGISIAMSVLAVFLYTAISFGWIRKKWPMIPVFILGFFFHIFVKDLNTLKNPEIAVSFSGLMQEISVHFMILAMIFISFAMKNKRSIESLGLPKIKAPKVIVKKDREKTGETDVPECLPEESREKELSEAPEVPELEKTEPKEIPETAASSDEKEPAVSEEVKNENTEIKPDTGAEQ